MNVSMFPVAVLSANGNSIAFNASGRPQTIIPSGGFGGGTLTLKASYDNGTTFVALNPTVTWTTSVAQTFTLAKGVPFRVELAGSTTPTLTAQLFQDDSN